MHGQGPLAHDGWMEGNNHHLLGGGRALATELLCGCGFGLAGFGSATGQRRAAEVEVEER